MAKKQTLTKAFKETDTVYSLYIRKKASDFQGYVSCITCGVKRQFDDRMDAGHYVSRRHKSLRYYDRNVHPQCSKCNRYNEGEKDIYALRLKEKYGEGILEELNDLKNTDRFWTIEELKEFRKELRRLTKVN